MTWLDEDIKKVEKAIFDADQNTKYPNEINEIFNEEGWVVDFYRLGQCVRDKIQDTWENNEWDTISEKYLRECVMSEVSVDILTFVTKVYENAETQLEDEGIKVVKRLSVFDNGR